MDDYHTPKVQRVREAELRYNLTPIVVTEPRRLEEAETLRVNTINIRSSTPTYSDLRSPGLSPIKSPLGSHNQSIFKNPNKLDKRSTPIAKIHTTKPSQQQQQQNSYVKSSPSCVINVSLTSPSEYMCDILNGSQDSSNSTSNYNNTTATPGSGSGNSSTGILNRTLNVTMLLQIVGLEMYVDVFEKEGIDLEKFLNIQQDDLLRMGLVSEEHCKVLMDLQKDYTD